MNHEQMGREFRLVSEGMSTQCGSRVENGHTYVYRCVGLPRLRSWVQPFQRITGNSLILLLILGRGAIGGYCSMRSSFSLVSLGCSGGLSFLLFLPCLKSCLKVFPYSSTNVVPLDEIFLSARWKHDGPVIAIQLPTFEYCGITIRFLGSCSRRIGSGSGRRGCCRRRRHDYRFDWVRKEEGMKHRLRS